MEGLIELSPTCKEYEFKILGILSDVNFSEQSMLNELDKCRELIIKSRGNSDTTILQRCLTKLLKFYMRM